jgi:hypothetical protein
MKTKKYARITFLLSMLCVNLYAQKPYELKNRFDEKNIPPKPDYSKSEHWAALPTKEDMADRVPLKSNLADNQTNAKADVFFLHPTIFTYQPTNQFEWNGDVNDAELNEKVDNSTILNQATAFNGSCKIYAPRYRQAHYYSFLTPNKEDMKAALDLAYSDIKAAFDYYMKNYNNGRPIVIASHSQGTVHAKRLLKEYFDGKPLQSQLVEAYLIGIATQADTFENIKPSNSPDDVGGFVSWNTFARDFYPEYHKNGLSTAVCTNPLTWKTNEEFASEKLNTGGVGLKYTFVNNPADAQCNQGLLWINKPYIKGRIFIKEKIWHKADINLFWMNVRENVALRLKTKAP